MQSLPGFRDVYPEDYALRKYMLQKWREVARRYAFVEYDAPTIESSALYEKKNSGGEILTQLYRFEDRGERDVSLRPEMTPSLARMVASRANQLRKPVKWFSVANFFRYERQQKGRLREFLQLNCDIIGDSSTAADAELLALTIDILRAFGFGKGDFVLRLSDRRPWLRFLSEHGQPAEAAGEFLAIIDKMEREKPEVTGQKFSALGISKKAVDDFIATGGDGAFEELLSELEARGLEGFAQPDLTIVRGLAYYTGTVFEVFDSARSLRAIAGGGRYDHLISSLSDGSADLPAIGMGMGDVVLGHFIDSHTVAANLRDAAVSGDPDCDIYVVIADPAQRIPALKVVQQLREAGKHVDFPMTPVKVGKQFQTAENLGARHAILVGAEWPEVKIKEMCTRQEIVLHKDALADWIKTTQL